MSVKEQAIKYLKNGRRRAVWRRILSVLSCIVVFVTTYALLLPALTLEQNASCGIEEHEHDDSCYEYQLVCGQAETEGHEHSDGCYTIQSSLICKIPEHTHNEDCYDEDGNLTCALAEHSHDDGCRREDRILSCGQEEVEAHHHTSPCYEKVLTCTKQVHVHSAKCYAEDDQKNDSQVSNSNDEADGTSASDGSVNGVGLSNGSINGTSESDGAGAVDETSDGNSVSDRTADGTDDSETGLSDETAGTQSGTDTFSVDGDSDDTSGTTASMDGMTEGTADGATDGTASAEAEVDTTPADDSADVNDQNVKQTAEPLYFAQVLTDKTALYVRGTEDSEDNWKMVKQGEEAEILSTDIVRLYYAYTIPAGSLGSPDTSNRVAYYALPENVTLTDSQIEKVNALNDGRGAQAIEGTRTPDQEPSGEEYVSAWIRFAKGDELVAQDETIDPDRQYIILTFDEYAVEKNQTAYDDQGNTVSEGEDIQGFFGIDVNTDQIDFDKDGKAEIVFAEKDKERGISRICGELRVDEKKTEEKKEKTEEGNMTFSGPDYTVTVSYDSDAQIPADAELSVREIEKDTEEYAAYIEKAQSAVNSAKSVNEARFFDISILADGEEIEPAAPVSVQITYAGIGQTNAEDAQLLHYTDDEVQIMDQAEFSKSEGEEKEDGAIDTVQFETDGFSVYAVVYTVDFHWEVDGKKYEYSLPGGGFMSFRKLVEVLGIVDKDVHYGAQVPDVAGKAVSEETRKFVEDVEKVEFSNSELVWIGKIDADTTVSEIKSDNELEEQYSAALTEEEINSINSTKVQAGDWALISMLPFQSEETLTVTMKTGEVFTIKVTDAQISTHAITADGKDYLITVTYGEDAGIPDGAALDVKEIINGDKEYTDYVRKAAEVFADGKEIPFVNAARLFDISIMVDGKKFEPKAPVEVRIEYANAENLNETSEVGAVHFKENFLSTEAEKLDVEVQGEGQVEGVTFTTDSFSIYAVVIIDKEAGTFIVEDNDYKVTVTYTKEANLPIGTELTVKEITPEEGRYWELWKATQDKINEDLQWEHTEMTPDPRKGITDAVFFDINLVYGGNEVEPDVPLLVKIEYKENGMLVPESEDTKIIHFAKTGTEIIDDVDVRYSESANEHGKYAVAYEYAQGSFSAVGSYSTGEYIEINESNIINPSAGILAAPSLNAAGDSGIKASKTITDEDEDGIYDLTLSVTGQFESSTSTKVNKANVVLVIDTSGSMGDNYVFIKDTGTDGEHYGVVQNRPVKVYYIDGEWYYISDYYWDGWRLSPQYSVYTGERYLRQTRLEATKAAANDLVHALLANNKNETTEDGVSLRDAIEISLIEFSSVTRDYNGPTSIDDAQILVEKSTNESVLQGYINNLSAGGGTDWEAALRKAKTASEAYKDQTDESTFVIFLTDGMPTFYLNNADSRQAGMGGSGDEEKEVVHSSWNYASDDARALVNAGYTLYNIFAFGTDTVKFPNDNSNTDADYLRALTNFAYTGSGNYYNKTLTDTTKQYFFNAKDTTALQNAFSVIMEKITNSVGFGGVLVDDGVTVGVTSTSVTVNGETDTDQFHYAIKVGDTTVASVRIKNNTATFTIDGSNYTSTGETVTTVIDGITHTNTVYSVIVGNTEYKISPASFDDAGLVQWDLAGIGSIPNEYTYELSFNVWPNQLSFDMVADLNNGLKTMEQLKNEITQSQGEAVWNQISKAFVHNEDGTYSIRTNYEEYVDYYLIESEINETTGDKTTVYTSQPRKELGPKDPIPLTSTTMNLRKIWDDSLDRDQKDKILWKDITRNDNGEVVDQTTDNSKQYHVKLHVWKADTPEELQTKINTYAKADANSSYAQADANDYIDKTLGWNSKGSVYDWDETLEVAPGTMVKLATAQAMEVDLDSHTQVTYNGQTYVILEPGHYYTVTEENIDTHFELNTITYHPMLVDGVLSNVTFKEDGTVEKITAMSTVDAANTLKGGINITKTVKDADDNTLNYDGLFEASITLTPPAKPDNIEDYMVGTESKGKVAWYYYVDGNENRLNEDALLEAGILEKSEDGKAVTGENYDGGGWFVLWFQDYTKGESLHDATGTLMLSSKYPIRFTNMAAGTGYSLTETDASGMTPSVTYSHEDADGKTVEGGQVVMGNTASNIDVINTTKTANIKVLKVDMGNSSIHLDGVKFELYADAACTKQITKNASGTALGSTETIDGIEHKAVLTTDATGEVSLGALVKGTYYLREIKPKEGYYSLSEDIVINIRDDKVTYGTSMKEADLNEGIYTIVVMNSAGAELPYTGGPGTRLFTTLGSILTLGAGALLWRRRRTI